MTGTRARLAPLAIALMLASAAARAGEGYKVEGTMHDDFPSVAGRVAILPPAAPEELETAWLERKIAGLTDMRPKAPLVPLREVRAAIARLAPDLSLEASRRQLAAELGVDSFLEIRISDLAAWKSSEAHLPDGGTAIGKEKPDTARAKINVQVVAADSGTLWFEGTTDGTQLAKGIKPIVSDMLDKLFERAFPARRYR